MNKKIKKIKGKMGKVREREKMRERLQRHESNDA